MVSHWPASHQARAARPPPAGGVCLPTACLAAALQCQAEPSALLARRVRLAVPLPPPQRLPLLRLAGRVDVIPPAVRRLPRMALDGGPRQGCLILLGAQRLHLAVRQARGGGAGGQGGEGKRGMWRGQGCTSRTAGVRPSREAAGTHRRTHRAPSCAAARAWRASRPRRPPPAARPPAVAARRVTGERRRPPPGPRQRGR